MPPQSSAITLSRCDSCAYEASAAMLVGGLCYPCREWAESRGLAEEKRVIKPKAKPVKPKIRVKTRTITVREAMKRTKLCYGYIPRFVVNIIRARTKCSGKTERIPINALPKKAQGSGLLRRSPRQTPCRP